MYHRLYGILARNSLWCGNILLHAQQILAFSGSMGPRSASDNVQLLRRAAHCTLASFAQQKLGLTNQNTPNYMLVQTGSQLDSAEKLNLLSKFLCFMILTILTSAWVIVERNAGQSMKLKFSL